MARNYYILILWWYQSSTHSFHLLILGEWLLKSICKSLQIPAKVCETMNSENTAKPYLRICAKPCESLRNHTCESLRNLSITAKAYLRKLAKIHAFSTCESLRKHDLQNLAKGVFIARPHPPGSGRARSTRSISVVILNVFRLFVITIPKPTVSVVFLSFVCPKSFIIQVSQLTCEEIQLYSWFKSIRSCVIYLT